MHDDTPSDRARRGAPRGPRSAGLALVPAEPLAPVIQLPARAPRPHAQHDVTPGSATVLVLPNPSPAAGRGTGSIQDRIRQRALEAALLGDPRLLPVED